MVFRYRWFVRGYTNRGTGWGCIGIDASGGYLIEEMHDAYTGVINVPCYDLCFLIRELTLNFLQCPLGGGFFVKPFAAFGASYFIYLHVFIVV
jgi:hypothetical protein